MISALAPFHRNVRIIQHAPYLVFKPAIPDGSSGVRKMPVAFTFYFSHRLRASILAKHPSAALVPTVRQRIQLTPC